MDTLRRFETIADYNSFNNNETRHPLVSVVDLSKAAPRQGSRMYFGFYTIFFKDVKCGDLVYGRHTYDYQEGTLVFLGPGQVAGVNSNGETYQPKGYALVFHPDLIHGTQLGRHIGEYTFFSYQSNEALHLSGRERDMPFGNVARSSCSKVRGAPQKKSPNWLNNTTSRSMLGWTGINKRDSTACEPNPDEGVKRCLLKKPMPL